jgi:predicted metal-dependent HD superfamily phosphohydrolase
MQDDIHADLSRRWAEMIDALGVSGSQAAKTFADLIKAYSDPDRYYHNLEHLASILKVIDYLKAETGHLPLVQLAGWFHDAIYDPRASDNEERSAVLAESTCASWGLTVDDTALVGRLIRATRTHQTDETDGFVLLDADLSILGAEEGAYDRYMVQISLEYGWVSKDEYRRGRTRVLRGFLERERIFRLERMRRQFEAQARSNLAREIVLLGRV